MCVCVDECVFLYCYKETERERENVCIQRPNEESVDCDLLRQNKHEALADEELLLASEEQHARKLLASS